MQEAHRICSGSIGLFVHGRTELPAQKGTAYPATERMASKMAFKCEDVKSRERRDFSTARVFVDPDVTKAGGLHRQGAEAEAEVCYDEPLATLDMDSSGFPEG